jgi:hypothetical protein
VAVEAGTDPDAEHPHVAPLSTYSSSSPDSQVFVSKAKSGYLISAEVEVVLVTVERTDHSLLVAVAIAALKGMNAGYRLGFRSRLWLVLAGYLNSAYGWNLGGSGLEMSHWVVERLRTDHLDQGRAVRLVGRVFDGSLVLGVGLRHLV